MTLGIPKEKAKSREGFTELQDGSITDRFFHDDILGDDEPMSEGVASAVKEFLAERRKTAKTRRKQWEASKSKNGDAVKMSGGDSWVKHEGARGGSGWKNSATGEIRYQKEKPGGGTSGTGKLEGTEGSRRTANEMKEHAEKNLVKWQEERDERAEKGGITKLVMGLSSEELFRRREAFRMQYNNAKKHRPDDAAAWKKRYDATTEEVKSRKAYYNFARRREAAKRSIEEGKLFITDGEAAKLVGTHGDVYVDAGMRRPYGHVPELFITSDLTGRKMRRYVKLPDGRMAHPDEIIAAKRRGRIVVDSNVKVPSINWESGEVEGWKSLDEVRNEIGEFYSPDNR